MKTETEVEERSALDKDRLTPVSVEGLGGNGEDRSGTLSDDRVRDTGGLGDGCSEEAESDGGVGDGGDGDRVLEEDDGDGTEEVDEGESDGPTE